MDAVVVEHVFVTTMSAGQAMAGVGELLAHHGFVAVPGGFAMSENAPSSATFMRKARRRAFRLSRAVLDARQDVRVDFDRGRVTVVAALENLSADMNTTGRRWISGRIQPLIDVQTRWVMALARAIEVRLDANASTDPHAGLVESQAEAAAYQRKRSRRALIIFAIILAIVIGVPLILALTLH